MELGSQSCFCLLIVGIVGKMDIGKNMEMGDEAPREYNIVFS